MRDDVQRDGRARISSKLDKEAPVELQRERRSSYDGNNLGRASLSATSSALVPSARMKPRLLLPLLLCTVVSASTTLIDLLSLSPAHSLLVRAIQRARLVPLINGLNGTGTMLAPTDEAIRREVEKEQQLQAEDGVWTWALSTGDGHQLEDELQHDNLQLALRDTILYHLFNYTLWKPPPPPSNFSLSSSAPTTELPLDLPQLHETLYIPSLSSFNKSFPTPPSLPGSPPSDPPSKPERGRIEGMLKGEGQRVRLVRKEGKESKEGTTWAGTDWEGEGGARLAKEKRWSSRGELLWSLDGVLQKPKDLGSFGFPLSLLSISARANAEPKQRLRSARTLHCPLSLRCYPNPYWITSPLLPI